jgi:hypothetical protein
MWNANPSPGFKWRPRKEVWEDGVNNVFDPSLIEARSYRWWTYVAKIKGKVVFNNYPYSHSTVNHQRNMRALLKKLKIKIDFEVSMPQSLTSFYAESLPRQYREMFEIEVKSERARKKGVYVESLRQHFDTHEKATVALKLQIKACRQLGAKMKREDIANLRLEVFKADKARREIMRQNRAEVSKLSSELKTEMNNFEAIPLDMFTTLNDFNEIKMGA